MNQKILIDFKNWRNIKCGNTLHDTNGKEWTVVYRMPSEGIVDVAPLGASRGREARLIMIGDTIVVQTSWAEAQALAGKSTHYSVPASTFATPTTDRHLVAYA